MSASPTQTSWCLFLAAMLSICLIDGFGWHQPWKRGFWTTDNLVDALKNPVLDVYTDTAAATIPVFVI